MGRCNEDIIDITDLEIDVRKDKNIHFKELLKKFNFVDYNRKVRVGNTIIDFKFPNNEKITNRIIMKALDY
ncbi:MAG: hypothetical protein ACK5LV_04195 [Lachnospirales bacterium]